MKNRTILSIIGLLFLLFQMNAQNQYASTLDSDKEAIAIIEKTKGLFNNAKSLVFDFTFISRIPEYEPTLQSGIAKQKGDMYYLEMGDQTIYCDGKSIKIFMRTQNEVQINDLDEDSGMLTPNTILNSFDTKNYIYVLGEEKTIKKNKCYNLIFKPVDKFSEYSKIETLIDKKTLLPHKIQMFSKDGTRNILKINSVKMNQKIENNVFIFNETDHPGVSVEDLRMN
jgi:outer membrane lipoprotein-sorting protein